MENMEDIYDRRIAPLMAEVIAICNEYRIPIVASFQLNDEEEPLFCTTALALEEAHPKMEAALNVLYYDHVAVSRDVTSMVITALQSA